MSDRDKLHRLREWLGPGGCSGLRPDGTAWVRDDLLAEIDRLLAEPEPAEVAKSKMSDHIDLDAIERHPGMLLSQREVLALVRAVRGSIAAQEALLRIGPDIRRAREILRAVLAPFRDKETEA